jgi:anti-anti-sigma factor
MASSLYTITAHEIDQAHIGLVLAGEFDLAATSELDQALSDALNAATEVTVDLYSVTFVDAQTIASFVTAAHKARHHGRRLSIVNARDPVRHLLDIAGVLPQLLDPNLIPARGLLTRKRQARSPD